MSKLDDLIAELCPNGVNYMAVSEIAKISAGGDLPDNYVKGQTEPSVEYPYPIYSNGTGECALYGYTDSYKIEDEAITVSARGTIGYHEVRAGKFTPIVRLITVIVDKSIILTKFLNYAFDLIKIEGVKTGIPSLTVPMLKKYVVPVPPLPVQREIVRILDNFTELTADLTEELTARKKQYEYYRENLLKFDDLVSMMRVGDLCDVFTGGEAPADCIKGDVKDDAHPYPVWGNGKEVYGYAGSYRIDKDAVVISSIGANTGTVYFHEAYFTPIIRLKVIIPKTEDLNMRFLYHALSAVKIVSKSSSVPNMNANEIKNLIIPHPPIEEQERIANILDRFDILCNDISDGLPAEIEARQKQYEYFRDKLLSFENIGDSV